ncbi:MAG: hypothetical protein SFV32_12815 [Opitutaceae bacterium]|nr:hypothetical protein [Opitutaceae bacterium]
MKKSILAIVGLVALAIPCLGQVTSTTTTTARKDEVLLVKQPQALTSGQKLQGQINLGIANNVVLAKFSEAAGVLNYNGAPVASSWGTLSGIPANITSWASIAPSSKQDTIAAGTSSQYRRGDNTWQTLDTSAVAGLTGALAGKENTISAGTTSQYFRGDKSWRDFATDVGALALRYDTTQSLSATQQRQGLNNLSFLNTGREVISRAGHGFSVGQWVFQSGGTWYLADRSIASTVRPYGVVESVPDANTFVIVSRGVATISGGSFTAGLAYYVDLTGTITPTKPTSGFGVLVGQALTSTQMLVAIGDPFDATPLQFSEMQSIPGQSLVGRLEASTGPPATYDVTAVAAALQPYITAAAPTEATPTLISGTDIDFLAGTERFKNIAGATTFSLSNLVEGRRVRIDLNNTSGSSANVTFTGAITPSAAQLTLAAGTLAEFELVRKNGVTRARVVQSGYAVDNVPPTLTWAIDATGLVLTGVASEPLYIDGGGAPTNVSLTNLTPSVTLSGWTLAGDRLSATQTISRAILSSETPQITIGASNGIRDATGNQVATVTGGAVTNGSGVSNLTLNENFGETNSGGALGSSTDGYDSPLIFAVTKTGSATVDPDATDMTGGKGAQQLKIVNQADGYGEPVWQLAANQSSHWFHFRFRAGTVSSWNKDFFALQDAAGTQRFGVGVSNSGSLLRINNNGSITTSGFALSANTTYYVWVKFNQNGACGVYLSTTSTRPTVNTDASNQVIEVTGYNGTIRRVKVGMDRLVAGFTTWYSNLQASANEIGNNP